MLAVGVWIQDRMPAEGIERKGVTSGLGGLVFVRCGSSASDACSGEVQGVAILGF
jgi:hypothetical protein